MNKNQDSKKELDRIEAMKKKQNSIEEAFIGNVINEEFEKFKQELIDRQSQEVYQKLSKIKKDKKINA